MNTPTHPHIDRLADTVKLHGSEELCIADVEHVLARKDAFVRELLTSGKLECWKETVRAGKRRDAIGRAINYRYTISAGAVLVYLWRSTAGDRTALRHAIATRFPHHLAMVEASTASAPAVMQALLPANANTEADPATLPKNVLPFRRSTKPAKPAPDPYAGHPDLFSSAAHA